MLTEVVAKDGRSRVVHLNKKAKEIVKELHWDRDKEFRPAASEYVFPSRQETKKGHLLDLRNPFEKACQRSASMIASTPSQAWQSCAGRVSSKEYIFLLDTKNGRSRTVHLNAKAQEVLVELLGRREQGARTKASEFVFPSRLGD